jgi:hypothetical protein
MRNGYRQQMSFRVRVKLDVPYLFNKSDNKNVIVSYDHLNNMLIIDLFGMIYCSMTFIVYPTDKHCDIELDSNRVQ